MRNSVENANKDSTSDRIIKSRRKNKIRKYHNQMFGGFTRPLNTLDSTKDVGGGDDEEDEEDKEEEEERRRKGQKQESDRYTNEQQKDNEVVVEEEEEEEEEDRNDKEEDVPTILMSKMDYDGGRARRRLLRQMRMMREDNGKTEDNSEKAVIVEDENESNEKSTDNGSKQQSEDIDLTIDEDDNDNDNDKEQDNQEKGVKPTSIRKLRILAERLKFQYLKPKLHLDINIKRTNTSSILISVTMLEGKHTDNNKINGSQREYEMDIMNSEIDLLTKINLATDVYKIFHDKDCQFVGIILNSQINSPKKMVYKHTTYSFGKLIFKKSQLVDQQNFENLINIFKKFTNVKICKDYESLYKLMNDIFAPSNLTTKSTIFNDNSQSLRDTRDTRVSSDTTGSNRDSNSGSNSGSNSSSNKSDRVNSLYASDQVKQRTDFLNKRMFSLEKNLKKSSPHTRYLNKDNINDGSGTYDNETKSLRGSSSITRNRLSSPFFHKSALDLKGNGDDSDDYVDPDTSIGSLNKKHHISTYSFYGTNNNNNNSGYKTSNDFSFDELQRRRSQRKQKNSASIDLFDDDDDDYKGRYTYLDDPDNAMEIVKPFDFGKDLKYQFDDKIIMNITNKDFQCLFNSDWVNDSIIDFFLKYYSKSEIVEAQNLKIFTFNTFFFTKLLNCKNSFDNIINDKWLNKNNCEIFTQNDYLILPINISYHWFGCIIENYNTVLNNKTDNSKVDVNSELSSSFETKKENVTNEKDEKNETNDQTKQPEVRSNEDDDLIVQDDRQKIIIYVFDSLRNTHSMDINFLKDFLIQFALTKFQVVIDRKQIKIKNCQVPLQPNMNDCGIHLILNTKTFLDNPQKTIELWNENSLKHNASLSRDNLRLNEYFQKDQRKLGRKMLRQTLMDLQFESLQKSKEEAKTISESETKEEEKKTSADPSQKTTESQTEKNSENEQTNDTEPEDEEEDLEIIEIEQPDPKSSPEKDSQKDDTKALKKLLENVQMEIDEDLPNSSKSTLKTPIRRSPRHTQTKTDIDVFLKNVAIKSSPTKSPNYPFDENHTKKPSLKDRSELINRYQTRSVSKQKSATDLKVSTQKSSHLKESPGVRNLSKHLVPGTRSVMRRLPKEVVDNGDELFDRGSSQEAISE